MVVLPVPRNMVCEGFAGAFAVTEDMTAAHLRAFQMYSLARGKDSVRLSVEDTSGAVLNMSVPVPDIQPDSISSLAYLEVYRERYEGTNVVHLFVDENGTVSDERSEVLKNDGVKDYLDSMMRVSHYPHTEVFINASLEAPAGAYLRLKLSIEKCALNQPGSENDLTGVEPEVFRLCRNRPVGRLSVSRTEFYHTRKAMCVR